VVILGGGRRATPWLETGTGSGMGKIIDGKNGGEADLKDSISLTGSL